MSAVLHPAIDRKRLETLRADAAFYGILVELSANDLGYPTFVVTRGAVTFEAETIEQLAVAIRTVREAANA